VGSRSRARARAQVSEAGAPEPPRRPRSLAGADAGSGRSYHASSGIALTVIGIVTALALGYVAAGVAGARAWSRTPALLTQLFTAIVSIYLIQASRYEWGVPGLVLAVAGFVTLLVPPSLRALARQPRPPADQAKRRT